MWRQDVSNSIKIVSVLEPTDTGAIASPIYSSAFNMNDYRGWRFAAILRAALSLTGAVAHGMTFSLQDADASADAPVSADWLAKAEVSAVLAKLTAVGVQAVSFWPKEGGAFRPWVRVKALSDDNATLFSVSALVIAIPPGV